MRNQNKRLVIISDVGTDHNRNALFNRLNKEFSANGVSVLGVFNGVGLINGDAKRKVDFPVKCLDSLLINTTEFENLYRHEV